MKSQLLATLLILVPVLAAQDDGAQQPPKPPAPTPPKQGVEAQETQAVVSGESEIEIMPDGSKIIRTTNEKGEQIEKHIPPGDPAAGGVPELPPDEMARRGGGYFDAAVMVRPRRLAPGESGDLYVHVTLRGHAVVVPGATINLTYAKTQGSLTLGTQELQPAKPGVRETRYKGKPVYDDSLTFKIPLGIAGNAKFGKAPFTGSVLLEVSDGRTGEMIGRFRAEAPGQVLIGRPFPRPVPQVGPKGTKASGVKAGAGSRKVPAAADATGSGHIQPKGAAPSKATDDGHLVGSQSPGGAREGAAPGQSGEAPGTASGFDTLDLAFWGVGGLLLLGLALLVLRRR